jgi:hypothetical protein
MEAATVRERLARTRLQFVRFEHAHGLTLLGDDILHGRRHVLWFPQPSCAAMVCPSLPFRFIQVSSHSDGGSEPWAERETKWNYYYLRSSLTYDDFFGAHILSQGAIYQYVMGFQGAARDPLQHALPFLFSDPWIVKQVLRYTLKEVRADGSIPYAIVGHGAVACMTSDNSSDMPLWLLWAVSEYVLATRDKAFLKERIPAALVPGSSPSTVRQLLARCYRHVVEDVGTGEHGLMRMLQDDWNDALVMSWAQHAIKECVARGESVLNSGSSRNPGPSSGAMDIC